MDIIEVGFGGGCHWCTEAIFLSLKGVTQVQQGWIASIESPTSLSEGVIVSFAPTLVSLEKLVAIHLRTHSATSAHSMRNKYRSAVYAFSDDQLQQCVAIMHKLQHEFANRLITEVITFGSFKSNKPEYLNYYYANVEKPFCENIVNPKLLQLLHDFPAEVDQQKLHHLLPDPILRKL